MSYRNANYSAFYVSEPFTDLRHTIWTGDAYHPQTSICRADHMQ